MKPNPFSDPWEEVAMTFKNVANVLVNFSQVIMAKDLPNHAEESLSDFFITSFYDGESEEMYNSINYAKKLLEYFGDIYLFLSNEAEYVDERDVNRDTYAVQLGDFIMRWCLPMGELQDADYKYFWNRYNGREIPQEASRVLRSLKYEEFLKTGYWKAISMLIRKCGKCELCGSTENLHVHHKTYENHGYEHLHLDDLQCLCKECHIKVHNELKKNK